MQGMNSLNARQIRAGRALLDWSQDELAERSGLSIATIRKIEAGNISPRGKTNDDICCAFEDAGLEFIEHGGVRHRPEDIKIYQGHEGAKAFFDDVYRIAESKGGDIVVACPSDDKYFIEPLGDYLDFHVTRMQSLTNNVQVKCILTEDKNTLPAASYCEYRWISKHYVDSVPFYVYGDKYAIIIPTLTPHQKSLFSSRASSPMLSANNFIPCGKRQRR